MTECDQEQVNSLKSNIHRLIELLDEHKKEVIQLKDQNKGLEFQLEVHKRELEELNKRYENLKVAKSMSGFEGENQPAKHKINKLVREIDKCIALLNN